MSVFSRTAIIAFVFTASVGAAAYAANNNAFYSDVRTVVGGLAHNVELASGVMAGDMHAEDPLATDEAKRVTDRIPSSSVVTHVEVIGGSDTQRIVLLDPSGGEVFVHDADQNTTTIAKDVRIPSFTLRDGPNDVAELRVVTAAAPMDTPEALRQALITDAARPDLFYRDDF